MKKSKISSAIFFLLNLLCFALAIYILPITTSAQMMVISMDGEQFSPSFLLDDDDNYIIIVNNSVYSYLFKILQSGEVKWAKSLFNKAQTMGNPLPLYAYSINKTSNGGFVIVGSALDEIDFYWQHGMWTHVYCTLGFVCTFDSADNFQKVKLIWNGGNEYTYSTSLRILSITPLDNDKFAFVCDDSYQDKNNNYTSHIGVGIIDLKGGTSYIHKGGDRKNWFKSSNIYSTNDSGYVVAFQIKSLTGNGTDIYVYKYGKSNTWEKTIGNGGKNIPNSIIQTKDGGYAIVGSTDTLGQGANDIYVLKLDSVGNVQWSRIIGGQNDDIGFGIIQTRDNGYAIVGSTKSYGQGGTDIYVVKLDSNGYLQWTRTIGGIANDDGYSITQDKKGNLIIFGKTYSFGSGKGDLLVAKLDSTGYVDVGSCGAIGEGGGALLGKEVVSKYNAGGAWGYPSYSQNLVSVGTSENITNVYFCSPFLTEKSNNLQSIKNYPNPFVTTTTITFTLPYACHTSVRIYNLLGQEIATVVNDSLPAGEQSIVWTPDGTIPPGVYFARIKAGKEIMIQKIILER